MTPTDEAVAHEVLDALANARVLRFTERSALAFLAGKVTTLHREADGAWTITEVRAVEYAT
jgi:hypothetical protein